MKWNDTSLCFEHTFQTGLPTAKCWKGMDREKHLPKQYQVHNYITIKTETIHKILPVNAGMQR
jgi:hypothetical protein